MATNDVSNGFENYLADLNEKPKSGVNKLSLTTKIVLPKTSNRSVTTPAITVNPLKISCTIDLKKKLDDIREEKEPKQQDDFTDYSAES